MPVITYTEVATELGRSLTDSEKTQAALWITDAELLIGIRLGDINQLNQDALKYVVRKAVAERFRRPQSGAVEESRQIDDVKIARKFSRGVDIDITDEWWELLSPDTVSSAFTIRPGARATRTCDAEPVDL